MIRASATHAARENICDLGSVRGCRSVHLSAFTDRAAHQEPPKPQTSNPLESAQPQGAIGVGRRAGQCFTENECHSLHGYIWGLGVITEHGGIVDLTSGARLVIAPQT